MRPLSLAEREIESLAGLLEGVSDIDGETAVGLQDYTEKIMPSDFPGMASRSDRVQHRQLAGYVNRIGDRDVRHHLWLKAELEDNLADMVVLRTATLA